MLPILIDTALIAVPPHGADAPDIERLIDRLVYWSGVLATADAVVGYKLSGAEDVLHECSCWPLVPDLREVFASYGLDAVFTPRDVINTYMFLVNHCVSFAEWGLEATDCSDISLTPDLLAGLAPNALVIHSRLVLMNSALSAELPPHRPVGVVSGLPQPGPHALTVKGKVLVAIGERSGDFALPMELERELLLLDRLEDLVRTVAPLDLWNSANDVGDYYLAVAYGCLQRLRDSGQRDASIRDLPKYAIGSQFIASLTNVQACPNQPHASVVFEACCQTVARQENRELRPMGVPHQIVREADGALAYRTHVTKGGEAIRLMIWRSGDVYELANVDVKAGLEIEHGDVHRRYTIAWS